PWGDAGAGRRCAVVLLARQARGLRFDPSMAVCRFRLGAMRLRRIGRAEAARTMWRAVSAGGSRPGDRLRLAAALAAKLLSGGPSAFAGALYARYAAPPIAHSHVGYDAWVKLYDPRTPEALDAIAEDVAGLAFRPRF